MELESAIYRCRVYHDRLKPKRNKFSYDIFMFSIDLDELPLLSKKFLLFGLNRFNFFSFNDKDHFKKSNNNQKAETTREKLDAFLLQKGISLPSKVKLVTHLRILGYVFNPVSFYYCYDDQNNIYCVIAEVTNTYGEMKMFILQNAEGDYFKDIQQKLFYISPFTELDDFLDLKIGQPGADLKIFINDFKENELKVKTVLTGRKEELSDRKLLKYALRFPLLTLQIISLIHWQALKLLIKGVQYIPKEENLHLQKDIYFQKTRKKDATVILPEDRIQAFE